eukprot:187069_1
MDSNTENTETNMFESIVDNPGAIQNYSNSTLEWILNQSELIKLRNPEGQNHIESNGLLLSNTNTKWHVHIYPNGYNSNKLSDYMQIYLYCDSVVHSIIDFEVKCQFDTFQTKWKSTIDHAGGKVYKRLSESVSSAYSTAQFIKFQLNIKINEYEIDYSDSDDEYEQKIDNHIESKTQHNYNDNNTAEKNEKFKIIYKIHSNHDMVFKWKIPEKTMHTFMSSSGCWHSPSFYIHGNKFSLRIYPNGTKSSSYNGSVAMYISLDEFESSTIGCTFVYEINVFECNVNACGCIRFNAGLDYNHSIPVWSPYTLTIQQIQKVKTLSFIIAFDIMRINYISNRDKNDMGYIEYETPNKWKIRNKINYKWNIQLNQEWYDAINGKPFYSNKFNNLWCLRMFPNGYDYNDKGQLNLSLKLLAMPPAVWFMVVNVCIKCMELNVIIQRDRVKFCIGELRYDLIEFKRIKINELRNMNEILIECDINFVGFYDKNWNKIIIDHEDNVMKNMNERLNELEEQVKKQSVIIKQLKEIKQRDYDEKESNNFNDVHNGNKIKKWLNDVVKLPQYLHVFIKDGFYDLNDVKLMKNDDLKEIGVNKLAHRLRILQQINVLK